MYTVYKYITYKFLTKCYNFRFIYTKALYKIFMPIRYSSQFLFNSKFQINNALIIVFIREKFQKYDHKHRLLLQVLLPL